ncbi:hypothetical protein PSQ19_07065 [Devosia algicola]|uniref:ABC transporter permease n=1 Tax=Devosia algicola TaxID=3026418 RepID=A0ABY7YRB3_9HYPH|nr:hypothetical protein [Devosia algicola]WDR03796.1 hypothetical protein PSQ19_07065 [Devosia algicola]
MQRKRAIAIAVEQRRVAQTRWIAAAMLVLPALFLLLISPW